MTADLDISRIPPELREELEKRIRMRDAAKSAHGFLGELHDKQQDFIRDSSRRKVALCSRRAGKSHLVLAWLIEGALTDVGGTSVYVARSKGNARMILQPAIDLFRQKWPQLQLELGERDGQLWLRVGASRHAIWLAGAKDQSEVGKFRGGKYRRVAVDEAQEYGTYLRELVVDVFEPALLDKGGDLALCGTPSPIPAGLFYEASTGDGGPRWSTHSWTLFDNPHIANAESEVENFLRTYGLSRDSATFRREYLGQWVRDEGALVYQYSWTLNGCTAAELPETLYYVLGVDIGFTDASAFVVVGLNPDSPNLYVVEAWKREGLTPSAVAGQVEQLLAKYGRGMRVVVDEGGIGKGYAEEMRQRYGIACEPAEKTKKRAFQEIVGGELRNGVIKIVSAQCKPLLDEISVLQWGPGKLAQDDRFEDHCADAFLYSIRASHNWYRPQILPPIQGSAEWHQAEALRVRKMIEERVRKRNKGKSWRDYRRK